MALKLILNLKNLMVLKIESKAGNNLQVLKNLVNFNIKIKKLSMMIKIQNYNWNKDLQIWKKQIKK